MHIEHKVGTRYTYRWSFAVFVTEVVDYAVFHAVCDIFRMRELIAVDSGIDGECGLRCHVFLPLYVADNIIKLVRIRSCEFFNRLEDAQSGAATQVGAIHSLEITLEADHSASHLNVFRAERYQFVTQDIFQTLKCLCDHLKFLFSHIMFPWEFLLKCNWSGTSVLLAGFRLSGRFVRLPDLVQFLFESR